MFNLYVPFLFESKELLLGAAIENDRCIEQMYPAFLSSADIQCSNVSIEFLWRIKREYL